MRHKLQPWDMGKKDVAQTWALWAMDVAYDTANNAYVLDLNARPAPTGTHHPSWYRDSRALIAKFFCHPICLWLKFVYQILQISTPLIMHHDPPNQLLFAFGVIAFCVFVVPFVLLLFPAELANDANKR